MTALRRYFRLLPAVFVVGFGLLAIKGIDLARAAQTAPSDAPDNIGLAPSGGGGAKPAPDFAADENTGDSSAAVDVLTSLTRRRAELEARERALNMRENVLVAGEGRVDQKIAALKVLQTEIQSLLSQRDAAQDKQIAALVKTYSSMRPKDAARIFDNLPEDVLLPVAKGMKSDVLAPVMAAMNPEAAQRLTVKLAALLKLPEAPCADDCPAPAPTPALLTDTPPPPSSTSTTAAVSPAPAVQTAAIAPAPIPPAPPAAAAPVQAAAAPPPPPKVRKPTPRKTAAVRPVIAETAPSKPIATAPAAPATNPVTAPVSAPSKPEASTSTPPPVSAEAPVKAAPAPSQAVAAPPAPMVTPAPAIGPPAAITPAKGG